MEPWLGADDVLRVDDGVEDDARRATIVTAFTSLSFKMHRTY